MLLYTKESIIEGLETAILAIAPNSQISLQEIVSPKKKYFPDGLYTSLSKFFKIEYCDFSTSKDIAYYALHCPNKIPSPIIKSIIMEAASRIEMDINTWLIANPEQRPDDRLTRVPFYNIIGASGCLLRVCDFSRTASGKDFANNRYSQIFAVRDYLPLYYQSDMIGPGSEYEDTIDWDKKLTEDPFWIDFAKHKSTSRNRVKSERGAASRAQEAKKLSIYPAYYQKDNLYSENNKIYLPKKIITHQPGNGFNGRTDKIDSLDYFFVSTWSPDEKTKEKIDIDYDKLLDPNCTEYATLVPLLNNIITHQENHLLAQTHLNINQWTEDLKNINQLITNKNLGKIQLTTSTRIYKYPLKDGCIFYIKNPPSNFSECKGVAENIELEYLPKPFPSHDSHLMKQALRHWASVPLDRKKKKNYSNPINAVPLIARKSPRESADNARIMARENNVHNILKPGQQRLTAYMATSCVRSSTEGLRFHIEYLKGCNPELDETSIPTDVRSKQEWCHLIGDRDGGEAQSSNLVAGSYQSNTAELAIETAMRRSGFHAKISVRITSYMVPYEGLTTKAYDDALIRTTLLQEIIKQLKPPTKSISKDTLYTLIVNPSPENLGQLPSLSTNILTCLKENKIGKNITKEGIDEFFSLTMDERAALREQKVFDGTSNKLTYNALRALYDHFCHHFYTGLHVASFMRYVINVDGVFAIDYVVDAQREEFDKNEFELTKGLISDSLIIARNRALQMSTQLNPKAQPTSINGKRPISNVVEGYSDGTPKGAPAGDDLEILKKKIKSQDSTPRI